MTTSMPTLRSLLIGLAALLIGASQADAQYYPRPYFSPNGGGAAATAQLIDRARSTIDVAMYSVSTSGPIWQALQRATARGVTVRVILNKATSSNKHKAAFGILASYFLVLYFDLHGVMIGLAVTCVIMIVCVARPCLRRLNTTEPARS